MKTLISALLITTASTLSAQEAPVLLRAARLLDVRTGRMIENASVLVQGARITALNPANPPAHARVIDLGDATLLPGLIDAHTHLSGEIGPNMRLEPVTETAVDAAFKAVKNGRTTILAGFTTVRDFGGEVTVALGRAVDRGDVVAPRIVPSRNALGITGGHCDETGYAPGVLEHGIKEGVADGPWEVVQAVRYQIKHGAQVIKTCATAGVLSMEGPVGAQQYTYEELKAMVDEAARHGVKVAAHAHGTDGIKAAVRADVASIEHGSMLDDETITLMKQKGTYLVPTTYLADRINLAVLPPHIQQKARQVLPLARASLRKAIAAGVRIAFGTDAAVFPHGENAREFAVLTSLGMTPLEALRTATINAADLLGTRDRGELAPGQLADIIAVPGNPLLDISVTERVIFVMQGGKTIKHEGTQISFN